MKMILGCLFVLVGTTLAASQMLPNAQSVTPPAPESGGNGEQSSIAVAAAVERHSASQAMPDLSESTAVTVSGLASNAGIAQPNATGGGAFPDPLATRDKRQLRRTNVRAHVESRSVWHCAYLGCPGFTIGGIGF